ncbi:MAG: hypothetical protein JST00_24755 [Deltaproteobacteria bacterium]|nr:hypothetical protein [Deltaproteobacteria bacterium]
MMKMPKTPSLLLVVSLCLAAATHAACSSDDATPATPPTEKEAGVEASTPTDAGIDTGPFDSGTKRDCKADVEADGLYKHLECTGLYADFEKKTVADDAKPYKPALEFWSDAADKSRFLRLPAGGKIDISDFDEWTFPNGTRVWKEFRIGGKRIETRLYLKEKDSWRHTSYRWNDAETDAVRKDSGDTITFSGRPPYEMPNTGQCDVCHSGRREPLLGIDAVSLGLPGALGVTLASLAAEGKLSKTPPVTSFTLPENAGGKAAPALGWLHANCGSCHNANPGAAAMFTLFRTLLRASDLAPPDGGAVTVEGLDAYKTAVNVTSSKQDEDAGVPYVRIVPGDPGKSLVAIMSGRRVAVNEQPNQTQMPPLVTRMVDTAGHKLLTDWISAIP